VRLGMVSWFFVEAKSFLFSVVKGSVELRVLEKRKRSFGVVLLGFAMRCLVVVDGGRGVAKS
jgi:hypothetical protein